MPSNSSRLPGRPPRPAPLRIWPFAVAGALVLLSLNGLSLLYRLGWLGGQPNVFRQVSTNHPLAGAVTHRLAPVRAEVPTYRHNLRFGNPTAANKLTIFTDPSCADCRRTVNNVISKLPLDEMELVYKIWPKNPADPTVGVLLQLAERTGHVEAFWRNIHGSRTDLTASGLLTMLEKSGVPLEDQQTLMATHTETFLGNLEQDLRLARNLELAGPPQFFLNNYKIDDNILTTANIGLYLTRIKNNEPLVQSSDYWISY